MKTCSFLTPTVLLLSSLVACACGEPAGDDVPGGLGGANTTTGQGDPNGVTQSGALCTGQTSLTLYNDSNYSFSNELKLDHAVVKDATNLTFDWSKVSRDMFNNEIDAATDIKSVLISLWPFSPAEIEDKLRTDELSSTFAIGAISAYPDGTFTSEKLLDFTLFGEPLSEKDVWKWFDTKTPGYAFTQDTHTFLLSVSGGKDARRGQRLLKTFNIDPSASEDTLSLDNSSTSLEYEIDLMRPVSVSVPARNADIELDWSGMTETSLGKEYRGTDVTEVVIARYDMTREELEDNFLQLRQLAEAQWSTLDLAGTSVQLSDMKNERGESFPGISSDGLWLVAMFCNVSCNSPAPISLTFLQACP